MNSAQSNNVQPDDLVKYINTEVTGKTTVYDFSTLGKNADKAGRVFGRANEALVGKEPGWEKTYKQASLEFKQIARFEPDEVYRAEAKLLESPTF